MEAKKINERNDETKIFYMRTTADTIEKQNIPGEVYSKKKKLEFRKSIANKKLTESLTNKNIDVKDLQYKLALADLEIMKINYEISKKELFVNRLYIVLKIIAEVPSSTLFDEYVESLKDEAMNEIRSKNKILKQQLQIDKYFEHKLDEKSINFCLNEIYENEALKDSFKAEFNNKNNSFAEKVQFFTFSEFVSPNSLLLLRNLYFQEDTDKKNKK